MERRRNTVPTGDEDVSGLSRPGSLSGFFFVDGKPPTLAALVVDVAGEGERALAPILTDETSAGLPRWAVRYAATLAEALTLAAKETPSAVLLNAPSEDDGGLQSVIDWTGQHAAVPVVVRHPGWSDRTQTKAIRLGVDDCLDAAGGGAALFSRVLWHAYQRDRMLREVDRPSNGRSAEWVAGPAAPASITAGIYCGGGFAEQNPRFAVEARERFAQLVLMALRQRHFLRNTSLTEEIDALATGLGRLLATPKDVYEIHKATLNELAGPARKRRKVVRVEAEYVLMGVMSRLAGYYRSRAVGAPPSSSEGAS